MLVDVSVKFYYIVLVHKAEDLPDLQQVKSLSEELLTQLYPKIAPVIYRRCKLMLEDHDEALDAVHDVYLLLFRNHNKFHGEASLMTWIYRVTTNHCLNRLRSFRVHKKAVEKMGNSVVLLENERSSHIAELRNLLNQLAKKVNQRRAQVFFHYYVDEMTQNEIAELLGVSDRMVRKELDKAKQAMTSLGFSLQALEEKS